MESAYRFAGNANSRIEITNAPALKPLSNYTISAWINFSGGTDNPNVFSTASYNIGTILTGSQRTLWANVRTTTGGSLIYTSDTYPEATWLHLIARRQGNVLSVFVNGLLQGETPVNGFQDYANTTYIPEIGGGASVDWNAFGGLIDDVKIYNRALPNHEISSLHDFERNEFILKIEVKTVRVSTVLITGKSFLLESSSDFISWQEQGPVFTAESEFFARDVDVLDGRRFFRIREVTPTAP